MNEITRLNAALWGLRAALSRSVYRLNDGGCGYFAYLAARALKARGFVVEVVTEGECEEDSPANGNWGKQHLGVRLLHQGVLYTFDSETGLRRRSDCFGRDDPYHRPNRSCLAACDYPFGQGMDPDEAEQFVRSEDWNETFDTKQLPTVRRLIAKYLR